MRKKGLVIFAMFAFLAVAVTASANVSNVDPGGKTVCENASWVVNNLSETDETTVVIDLGPMAYSWHKVVTRTIPPGGFQANALEPRTIFENKGPGVIQVNCQRQRFDRHDWKIDPGSGKTYQSDYHMDHVTPGTYIEPGLGMPEGTERGIFAIMGDKSESNR
jgi:hypothetical protein